MNLFNMSSTLNTSELVFWITDVFDPQKLNHVLKKRHPAYIVNDHFVEPYITDQKIYCVPLYFARESAKIIKNNPADLPYTTCYSFNFMINKKQVNRFLCMKLVELFNLSNYDYTWSGVDVTFDMTEILKELSGLGNRSPLSDHEKSFILGDIQIPKKFFYLDTYQNNSHIDNPENSWKHVFCTSTPWNHGLRNMFCSSAVSLITESLSFQKGTVFTEKTTYAILGKTFPIWVGGGVKQAEKFEQIGFDAFNDVVDHSYQYYDTLFERCYYAIKDNLHLLSDYTHAAHMREIHMKRLDHNKQLLEDRQIDKFCRQQIYHWPEDLQQVISGEIKNWI